MSKLEALIFDVDGTLADTERDGHRVAFNQAFTEAGLEWDWDVELYGELLQVTGGKERIRLYIDKFKISPQMKISVNSRRNYINVKHISIWNYCKRVQSPCARGLSA